MGRRVGHFVLAANLAVVCGCGAVATSVNPHHDAGDGVTDAAGYEQAEATPVDPASIRTPVSGTTLPSTSPIGADRFDGIGALDLFDGSDERFLASLFLDNLILDLLDPTGPLESLTFLERLCLEGDDPDYVCRRLYGE